MLLWQSFEAGAVGVDEAGRGPLAGPVVAAAVLLDPGHVPDGLGDSKTLTAARREALYADIRAKAWVGVGQASAAEIDAVNILQATFMAMRRAVDDLRAGLSVASQAPPLPVRALVDGNRDPKLDLPSELFVKGDGRVASIAAASIIAKVTRDRIMAALHDDYPLYGWAKNQGYPSAAHRAALADYGATPHHRRSFGPVRAVLIQP